VADFSRIPRIGRPFSSKFDEKWIIDLLISDTVDSTSVHLRRNVDDIRSFLTDLSLDSATFAGKYGHTQGEFIDKLVEEYPRRRGTKRRFTAFILLFARGIAISSRFSLDGRQAPTETELRALNALLAPDAEGIAEFIRFVFEVPEQPVEKLPISWGTLRLHRLGTTSLVFKVERQGDPSNLIVLKVSHVLFREIGPLAEATASYKDRWEQVSIDCKSIVRVFASGKGWVVEQFIHGSTLREYIEKADWREDNAQLLTRSNVFESVLKAVNELHRYGAAHGDLNPSNIILEDQGGGARSTSMSVSGEGKVGRVRLIDMGRNLLASETIGRVRSVDAKYVAPEVLAMRPTEDEVHLSADYYSLGHLLAACYGFEGSDGFYFLDETLYRDLPEIARIAARLLSESPIARVEFVDGFNTPEFHNARKEFERFGGLAEHVHALSGMLQKVGRKAPRSAGADFELLRNALTGDLGLVVDHVKSLLILTLPDRRLSRLERICSLRVLASAFWYIITLALLVTSICFTFFRRDAVGVGGALWMQTLLGRSTDQTVTQTMQIWIAGASFLVICYRYSVMVFGGITFWRTTASLSLRIASEATLWCTTFIVFPCVELSLFLGYRAWPWFASLGLFLVSLNSIITFVLRRQIEQEIRRDERRKRWLDESRGIREGKTEALRRWTFSLSGLAIFVLVLSVLATLGFIKDYLFDSFMIALINFILLSWRQVGQYGPILKSNLSQYAVVGEIFRVPIKQLNRGALA